MTFRWRTFGCALAGMTCVMAAVWSSSYAPYYLENDDVAMRMAFEGRTVPGAAPTGFALWPSAALGWLVVGMQRVMPAISWWDIVLAAVFLWSLAVLLALAWDAFGPGWLARATAIGMLAVAFAPLVMTFQFTISSTIAGGAAALLAISRIGTARPARGVLPLSALLFLAGLLIRPMGASAGAAVALVLLLPLVHTRPRWYSHFLAIAATVGASFIAVQSLDTVLYGTSDEWGKYLRYNAAGQPLIDWGSDVSTRYSREIREAAGWSENDWLMLQRSLGVDPEIHSVDRVNTAHQVHSASIDRIGVASLLLGRAARYSLEGLRSVWSTSALIIVAGGLSIAAYGTGRAAAWTLAVVVLFALICSALDIGFQRLPWRLLGPMEVIFAAAIVLTIGASRRVASPALGLVTLAVIWTMTAPVLTAQAREAASRDGRSEEIGREISTLRRLSPSLVIFYGSSFPREYWWRPFRPAPAGVPSVTLGWNNQNPQVQRYLADTGRQPLFRALCSDPSIFIVADRGSLDLVTQYMQEHFDTPVAWTQVYEGSFLAWRCSAVARSETP